MKCAEFDRRLNELLDARGRPQSDPALAEHQAHCPDCRRLAASYQVVLAAVAHSIVPQPSGELAGQVLRRLRIDSPRPRILRFPRTAMAAAALAAALIALILTPLFRTPEPEPNAGPTPPGEQLADRERPLPPETEAPSPSRIQNLAEAAHDRYQGLARETEQSFSVAMQIIPGLGGPSTQSEIQSPREPDPGWTSGVANGLKPVTRSTAGALHTLLKAVALPEDEAL